MDVEPPLHSVFRTHPNICLDLVALSSHLNNENSDPCFLTRPFFLGQTGAFHKELYGTWGKQCVNIHKKTWTVTQFWIPTIQWKQEESNSSHVFLFMHARIGFWSAVEILISGKGSLRRTLAAPCSLHRSRSCAGRNLTFRGTDEAKSRRRFLCICNRSLGERRLSVTKPDINITETPPVVSISLLHLNRDKYASVMLMRGARDVRGPGPLYWPVHLLPTGVCSEMYKKVGELAITRKNSIPPPFCISNVHRIPENKIREIIFGRNLHRSGSTAGCIIFRESMQIIHKSGSRTFANCGFTRR